MSTTTVRDPVTRALLRRVLAPLALLVLALRTHRVIRMDQRWSALTLLDAYKAEIGALLGATLVFTVLLWGLIERPRARRRAFVGVQLVVGFWAVLELAAHNFFLVTGTELDASLIHYAFTSGKATWTLITKSTPWWIFGLMGAGAVIGLGLPWWPRGLWAARRAPEPEPPDPNRVLLSAVAAALMIALALTPPIKLTDEPGFARPSTLGLLISAGDYAREVFRKRRVAHARFASAGATLTSKPATPPNIVVILLESTRAISTTPYNPKLQTTPFLDKLKDQSIFAERAYAVVPHTSKAITATLCGIEPFLSQPINEASPGGLPTRCLPKLLAEQGYRTAFFQSATEAFENRPQLVKNMGFSFFSPSEKMSAKGLEKANYFGPEDIVMLDPSKKWLDAGEGPFLLTYLTVGPHHNYKAPRKRIGYKDFGTKVKHLNNYLNALRYVDYFTEQVIKTFKARGLYKNTIFVILGDHGEGFGEHGRFQHDNVLYEEGLRIPMIIHDGRTQRSQRVKPLVNQLDVIPTVLKLAGFGFDASLFRGTDMTALPPTTDRTLYGYCWYTRRCMASITARDKVIHHFGKHADEVFDLRADPEEKTNIAKGFDGLKARLDGMKVWRSFVDSAYEKHFTRAADEAISLVPPTPQHPTDVRLGDMIRVVGYDLSAEGPFKPGDRITITYYFQALRPIPDTHSIFFHAMSGEKMRKNLDHTPVGGLLPIQRWKEGYYVRDEHAFTIPKLPWRTSKVEIHLGLYHNKSGKREPVTGSTPADAKDARLRLLTLPIKR